MRTLLTIAAVMLAAPEAHAQSWPERPVRVVVGFGAGGSGDVVARIVAARFSDVFGQQFVVENRPGATGAIGAELVARSAADGYTLMLATQPQISVVPLMTKAPYDPVKDFAPISNIGAVPYVLVINRAVPATNLAEFIDYARSRPGQLSYAVTGFGSVNHLTTMLLLKQAGLDMVPVAYKGGSSGLTDVMAGHVHAYLVGAAVALPHAESHDLRLLAVTSEHRLPQLPRVPTLAESGFPELKVLLWAGLMAPAGTPRPIIDRLSVETGRAVRDPEFAKHLAANGIGPLGSTPEEFAAMIARDIAFWRDAISLTGVRGK